MSWLREMEEGAEYDDRRSAHDAAALAWPQLTPDQQASALADLRKIVAGEKVTA